VDLSLSEHGEKGVRKQVFTEHARFPDAIVEALKRHCAVRSFSSAAAATAGR
jgi:hypothetical protein